MAIKGTEALIQASFYFHELFKKTVLATMPVHKLTRTQMDLMVMLHLEGPKSMSELSEMAGIAPEQTTRAMKTLKECGLASTERSDENRRKVIARLTDEGELLMIDHLRELDENLQATLEGLSQSEVAQLVQAAQVTIDIMGKTGLRHIVSCHRDG